MKRVEKDWGHELWLTANERYAMKVLYFKPGHKLSLHYHEFKDEVWYIEDGSGLATIDGVEMFLGKGDHIRIKPGVVHTIIPLNNESLRIVEASTHEVTDSIRIERGGKV